MFKQLFGSGKSSTLLESAFGDVTTMLQQSARMFDHALGALLGNEPLEVDLQSMDDVIDDSERMVRRSVLEHMTVNPQQDLVASLILVSIVQDAERIGDFARGLGELIPLAKSPRQGPPAEELQAIAGRLRPQVKLLRAAHGAIDAPILLGLGAAAEDDLAARPSHHDGEDDHEHDDFESFTVGVGEIAAPDTLLERLAPVIAAHDILRIKGFVSVTGRDMRLLVQAVGPRVQHFFDRDWREGEVRDGRLVVIGRSGLDRGAIESALRG